MTWRHLQRALLDQGFTLHPTTRHVLIRDADGRAVAVAGSTPSDSRGDRNLLADLRRAGLAWPWTGRDRRARRRE